MARMVATKAALSIRVDALADADSKAEPTAPSIGLENRAKLEARLRALEGQADASVVRSAFTGRGQAKYAPAGEARTYNDKADFVPTQREAAPVESAVQAALDVKAEKKRAKEERRAKKRAEKEARGDAENGDADADAMEVDGEESKESKKEKKRKRRESEAEAVVEKAKVRPLAWSYARLCSVCPCRMRTRTRRNGRQRRKRARQRKRQQRPRPQPVRQTALSRQKRSEESLRHSPPSHFICWLYSVIISSS